jgi:hypothetical protein
MCYFFQHLYVLPVHLIVYRHGYNLQSLTCHRIIDLNRLNRTRNNAVAYIACHPPSLHPILTTITLQPVYPDLDPLNLNALRSRLYFDTSTRTKTGNRLLHTTAPRRADVTLTIDGKEVTVPQGTALIQACVSAEIRFNPIDPFSDRGLLTSDLLFHPS